MRTRRGSFASNPVLIGAATVLVVLVAVFLAYNANRGLPFVPTYRLTAELPSAANLIAGNDVRIGGARVGAVSKITARRLPDGSTRALVELKLDRTIDPLPRDSTVLVRPRSALGLKYVEITRGTSARGYDDGDTIPIARARPRPVELDEVLNTFDARTRAGIQGSLRGFGDGLAGRGRALNATLGELPGLLEELTPVARNLSDRRTGLERLVVALGRTAGEVAPVAERQAALFRGLDTTFGALRSVRGDLQAAITEGRPALDAGIRDLPPVRPFLANARGLFAELRPGVRALSTSAPILSDALAVGRRTLRRTPPLNRRLGALMGELGRFARDPLVPAGVTRLRETVRSLRPTLDFVAPTQTRCNAAALWFRNVASLLSEGDANGTWQRFIIILAPLGPNSEQAISARPANGPTTENHLHSNNYPNTGAPGQPIECESANERYRAGRTVIGNVPGNQGTRVDGKP